MGMQERPLLVAGLLLMAAMLALGVYLALRPEPGVASPRPFLPGLIFVVGFYVVCAIIALIALDAEHALVTLLAGLWPTTAIALVVATGRRRTREVDGHLVDASRDDQGPLPALGADDERPLGDTPEAHDDIIPQDLPKDHPGRRAAEHQAAMGDGTTRGDLEGGATPAHGRAHDTLPEAEPDELEDARARRFSKSVSSSRR
jgi:hypothetical protein